jgi:hypothetical protein
MLVFIHELTGISYFALRHNKPLLASCQAVDKQAHYEVLGTSNRYYASSFHH